MNKFIIETSIEEQPIPFLETPSECCCARCGQDHSLDSQDQLACEDDARAQAGMEPFQSF